MKKQSFSSDPISEPSNLMDENNFEKKSDNQTYEDMERADDYDDIVATPFALIPPDVSTEHHTVRSRIVGFCCGPQPAMTAREKRVQVLKVLSLTLLPILGLWAFTAYSLNDSIEVKMDIEQTQIAVKFSVEIGIFLDRIQRERDMSVLYLTILGPETRAFLQNEYILTDEALQAMSGWPVRNDFNTVFRSKESFQDFLNDYRNKLDPHTFNIYSTMDFYNGLIEKFVEWLYGSIKESSMASIWKVLVAYQKIVTGMEHIGIERALGTVFFVEGRLPPGWHERYNYRVNIFKANYQSAVFYSQMVDPMYQQLVRVNGKDTGQDPVTVIIDSFRYTIQYSTVIKASITKGQWWFDNMTLYLDQLLVIQQHLATFINGELQNIIDEEEKNLTISACFLALVILMCPLLIYSLEALTSNIHTYALAVGAKTQELARAREKLDHLQYHKVPSPVAYRLRHGIGYSAEYFKSVSILFVDVHDFLSLVRENSPQEAVQFLDTVNREMEQLMDHYDVYRTHILQDCCMVASGLPLRNGGRHSAILGKVALALVDLVQQKNIRVGQQSVCLRVGMDTGPCLAGVVGKTLPRYCLFGDVIRIASKLMHSTLPNKIHVSNSTARSLKKHDVFLLKSTARVQFKDRDWKRKTFWLEGVSDREALGEILAKRINASSAPLQLSPQMAAKLQSHFGIHLQRQQTYPEMREGRRMTCNSKLSRSSMFSEDEHSHELLGHSQPSRKQQRKSVPEYQSGKDSGQDPGSSDSTDSILGMKHCWDQPAQHRREKGTGRKKLVEKKVLHSISETPAQQRRTPEQVVQSGSHPVELSSLVAGNLQSTMVSGDISDDHLISSSAFQAEVANADDLTEDHVRAASMQLKSDEEKVCSFSRSSSLDSQLKRKFSREVESRKGSWPEKSSESNMQTSKKLTSEQQVYSVSCLPGTGDVKARLEWEMQQSSWFLQFAKPSIQTQTSLVVTTMESEGQEDGESVTQRPEHSSPRHGEALGVIPNSPWTTKDKLIFTYPTTFPTLQRTPANSPCHSLSGTQSVVSLEGSDA